MAVLILKNISTEVPGTIGDYLKDQNMPFRIIELDSGEIPPPLDKYDTLIVLGGPMGVYEMDRYPHLQTGSRTIREALNRDMKILGVCLGSQMLAHCLGATVYPGPEKETGWHSIELTGDGLKDPLMRQLAIHPQVGDFWRSFQVLHWHGDTFHLPHGAVLLASSKLYRHQAFRFGKNAYGFQFHIEVTKEMILEWFKDEPDIEAISAETDRFFGEYQGRAAKFYKSFFGKG
ncbi:MAG TPA: type 1 glutamine amidotransferase [Thermodesulfovibrionales bacterium]|nr:type 1 glutamine amidotransferase [Thermodesulfovibrionales bacterium]